MTRDVEGAAKVVADIVAQLRKWGEQRPSDGLIKRQNLTEDMIDAIQAFALAAADTFEERYGAPTDQCVVIETITDDLANGRTESQQ